VCWNNSCCIHCCLCCTSVSPSGLLLPTLRLVAHPPAPSPHRPPPGTCSHKTCKKGRQVRMLIRKLCTEVQAGMLAYGWHPVLPDHCCPGAARPQPPAGDCDAWWPGAAAGAWRAGGPLCPMLVCVAPSKVSGHTERPTKPLQSAGGDREGAPPRMLGLACSLDAPWLPLLPLADRQSSVRPGDGRCTQVLPWGCWAPTVSEWLAMISTQVVMVCCSPREAQAVHQLLCYAASRAFWELRVEGPCGPN
jgi:hypothetical protein